MASVAVLVILLDQWSKYWAVHTMAPRMQSGETGPITLMGGFLMFVYTENTGAAFSLGTGVTWIFPLIAIVVAVVILRLARNLGSIWWAVAFGGLLGGLTGNLIDRLTRSPGLGRGYVVDFIQLPHWPIFNVSDMCIDGAAILMVVLSVRGVSYKGSEVAKADIGVPPPAVQ